jgi:hypothetical protein
MNTDVVVKSWKGGPNGRIELASDNLQSHLNLCVYQERGSYAYLTLSPAKGVELRDELLKLYPLPVGQPKPPKAHFNVGVPLEEPRYSWEPRYPLLKTYLKEVTETIGHFDNAVDAEVAAAAFNREQQERA